MPGLGLGLVLGDNPVSPRFGAISYALTSLLLELKLTLKLYVDLCMSNNHQVFLRHRAVHLNPTYEQHRDHDLQTLLNGQELDRRGV